MLLEANASCSDCKVGVNVNSIDQPVDLTTDLDSCVAARQQNTPPAFGGTGPACTETIATLQQIAVNGVIFRTGNNVICITNQQAVKKDILLTGDAAAAVVQAAARLRSTGA